MIRHKIEVKVDDGRTGNLVLTGEPYVMYKAAKEKINMQLYQAFFSQHNKHVVGTKGSITFTVNWECTFNGRAPKRPADVIAAEKKARARKWEEKRLRDEEREKRHQLQILLARKLARKRIQQQVDHAFAIGNKGTEPAAKYITCHCNAPAAYIELSQPLSKGAHVLDEDLITGAACASHVYNNGVERIPCDRLEFFYDGVRQIAVKHNE
jgi:hypothetical protein